MALEALYWSLVVQTNQARLAECMFNLLDDMCPFSFDKVGVVLQEVYNVLVLVFPFFYFLLSKQVTFRFPANLTQTPTVCT